MPTINPITYPQLYDRIAFGGMMCPGICDYSGWLRKYEYDVKKGKGTVGATSTFTSKPPTEGSVVFYLWAPEHWDQWEVFRPILKFDPTRKVRQAIDVYHPAFARIDVTSLQTTSIGPEMHLGKGRYAITCEFLEFSPAPPVSAVHTATGSDAKAKGQGPGKDVDPIADEQQKQIAALLEEANDPGGTSLGQEQTL